MGKNIVTTNCQLDYGVYTVAAAIKTGNTGFKINGSPVYTGPLTITLTSVTDVSGNICASMVVTINPSATKVKSMGTFVVLEGDKGTGVGTFTNSETGVTISESVTVTISNAGQNKVQGI